MSTSMWVDADEAAHLPRVGALVHYRAAEAHADGLQRPFARCERRDEAGIQSSGQKQAQGNVGNQVFSDHVLQQRAEVLKPCGLVAPVGKIGRRRIEPGRVKVDLAAAHFHPIARADLHTPRATSFDFHRTHSQTRGIVARSQDRPVQQSRVIPGMP